MSGKIFCNLLYFMPCGVKGCCAFGQHNFEWSWCAPPICMYMYVCLSVRLPVCLSVISVHLSVSLSACLSICLSICLSVHLCVSLSACLSICLSICLSKKWQDVINLAIWCNGNHSSLQRCWCSVQIPSFTVCFSSLLKLDIYL